MVLALDEAAVVVHDPQGFPFATLPLDDLMAAWRAEKIGYVDHAYNLRYDFRQKEQASLAQIVARTLPRLRQQATGPAAESNFHGGVAAYRQLIHILEQRVPDTFQAALVHFALPLGARRCLDGARFLGEAGLPEAAACLAQKSSLYGRAQYYAVQKRWRKVIGIVEELAEVEDCFIKALSPCDAR